jgi:hypothetical protein
MQLAVRANRWPSTCTEISTLKTTAVSQNKRIRKAGNKAQ